SKKENKYQLKNSKYLLYGLASSGKTEVYIESIKKLRKNEQALILVPELTLTPQAIERYGNHFDLEKIAILTSKIPKGQFYKNWQDIRSGQSKIIIGTRIAVLAPFKNLKLVVVDEEQDISFKQWDMHPRYDARTVSEKLSEIFKAKIIRGSATPSIESYFKAENGKYKKLKLSRIKNKPVSEIEVIDMKKEKWKKNYSPISKLLESEISYTLKNGLQVILFINRQGMSAFSICNECKTVLKCPKCDRALVYTDSGNYKCLHCNFKSDILSNCQKCHGINFRNIGLGTQKVEKIIHELFPLAITKRADFESMKKSGQQDELYQKFSNKKIDILIGTQMITKGWDLPNVGLIGIIDADSMLDIPDFRTNERAFQHVLQVSGRTGRVGSKFNGKVILQTFDPENETIKLMAEMNFEKLFSVEISEREIFNYPPFGKIIKLTHRNRNNENLEKVTSEIYYKLSKLISGSENFKLSSPQDPLVPKIRGVFKKHLILIHKEDKFLPPKIKNFLKKLSGDWIIDIDPISIM
ncbi:primosomal protein N', partial [Patescibacteria group bacterium]